MPIIFFDRYTEMPGCFHDIRKCQIALAVRYAYYLIKTSNGISDMLSICQGFFALF